VVIVVTGERGLRGALDMTGLFTTGLVLMEALATGGVLVICSVVGFSGFET
jgi:hypothetical protein